MVPALTNAPMLVNRARKDVTAMPFRHAVTTTMTAALNGVPTPIAAATRPAVTANASTNAPAPAKKAKNNAMANPYRPVMTTTVTAAMNGEATQLVPTSAKTAHASMIPMTGYQHVPERAVQPS